MKKTYETPSIEVVKFQYRNQVVAASGCISRWVDMGTIEEGECTSGNKHLEYLQ